MKYTVVWEPPAERDLTELWLRSRLRYAISQAANQIDLQVQLDPNNCGESRDEDRQVMIVWPLGVSFKIDNSLQEVRVLSVWQI